MPSDADKKQATDGDMATALAAMQEAILKKMDEGFAALDIRIKALEDKANGDGLLIKPADLQPLASSGVATMATEVADTVTTSMGLPQTNLPQYSQQLPLLSQQMPPAPLFAAGTSTSARPYAPQPHQARFPSFVPQQQQSSFPNITETTGAPRYHKFDFPKFDGKEDPLTWLNRCEQFFWGQHTNEASKVWLAAYHMVGVAQEWYMHLERDEGMPSWSRFKECCNLRFGPPIQSNPLGEIAGMHQSGTVTEYVEKFLSLLAHNDPLSTKQQVQLFTSGLTDLLRVDVEMQKPLDLQVAMSMARAYEQRATIITTDSKDNSSTTIGQPHGMSLTGTIPVGEERILRRLKAAEMADRREKGLCFNCDEKFSRGHRCQRLFYLEAIDDIAEEELP